jgi:hypothetical protein
MIMKSLAGAAVVTAGLLAGQAEPAKADVDFHIGIGTPGYYSPYYGYGPYYGYSPYYGGYDYYAPRKYRKLSCGQARAILRDRGYRKIRTRDCDGRTYSFIARRKGETFIVHVNSRSGAISRREI